MSSKIKHSGTIESIEENRIKVRIVQTSACASCEASGHCHVSDMKEKIIDVYQIDASKNYAVGDQVMVTATAKTGFKAILIAFIFPFAVVITTLFAVDGLFHNELITALASLSILFPYYLMVYFLRDKIREQFSFELER